MDKPIDTATHETKVRNQRHAREDQVAKKIIWLIVTAVMLIVLVAGFIFFTNVNHNFQPYNKEDTVKVEVQVEQGVTLRDLADILEEKKLIRSASTFNFYLKTKDIGNLQAGSYRIAPSMTLDEIIAVIKDGGIDRSNVVAKVLIKEGFTLEEIAKAIENARPTITANDVLSVVADTDFVDQLVKQYPDLLTSMTTAQGVKYKLEGYLFPATYDILEQDTAKTLVEKMVEQFDIVLTPYYEQIKIQNRTVHQVLTMASLAEKEAVAFEDRQKVISVFNNRLAINMPLQSDVTILYALGVHKEIVTLADVEVDSPYNLYKHVGYGPGPFNSPSEEAVKSVLSPASTDFLYFVGDLKTGNVYYSKTLDEHNQLVEQYVNN